MFKSTIGCGFSPKGISFFEVPYTGLGKSSFKAVKLNLTR